MTIGQLSDRELDTLLSGRVPPGRGDLADMADFVMAMESAVPETVRPSRELETLLAEGLSPEPADTAAGAGVQGRETSPVGTRTRRMRRALQLVAAKLATLGMAAKVGVAGATVAAGTVGAGAAGVLPAPVQDAVADAVAAVTPFELPSSEDEQVAPVGRAPTDATDEEPGVDGGRGIAEEASEGVGSGIRGGTTPDEHDEGSGQEGSPGLDRAEDGHGGESVPDSVPDGASPTADPGDREEAGSGREAGATEGRKGGSAPTGSGASGADRDADSQATWDAPADDGRVGGDAPDSTGQSISRDTDVDVRS